MTDGWKRLFLVELVQLYLWKFSILCDIDKVINETHREWKIKFNIINVRKKFLWDSYVPYQINDRTSKFTACGVYILNQSWHTQDDP